MSGARLDLRGASYTLQMGSDAMRDGMFLELEVGPTREIIGEVFYSDVTHTMTLTTWRNDVPLEAIEFLITRARARLFPKDR